VRGEIRRRGEAQGTKSSGSRSEGAFSRRANQALHQPRSTWQKFIVQELARERTRTAKGERPKRIDWMAPSRVCLTGIDRGNQTANVPESASRTKCGDEKWCYGIIVRSRNACITRSDGLLWIHACGSVDGFRQGFLVVHDLISHGLNLSHHGRDLRPCGGEE
jgi:hypothetical protein